MKRFMRLAGVFFLLLVIYSGLAVFCADDSNIIRVGFPIQSGLTEIDEHGNYTGYTVDYLAEIQKYTNWQYEFVQVEGTTDEQLSTLLTMLENGEIDLMGAMVRNDALMQTYDYPEYRYGRAYTVLAARNDNSNLLDEDYTHWHSLKIATYPGFARREEALAEFARVNGFTYQLMEFETWQEARQAVLDGEADATFSVDISMDSQFRAITRFSPTEYYFATTKGNPQLIRALNAALSNIADSKPYFETTLYDQYFSTSHTFFLSDSNRSYIQSLGKVRVLMLDGNAPLQSISEHGLNGITLSYLQDFSQATGLDYEVVMAANAEEFRAILDDPDSQIDMVAGIPSDSSVISRANVVSSLPYLQSNACLVYNSSYDPDFTLAAPIAGNTALVLDYINRNPNSCAYLDSLSVNLYLQAAELYKNITVNYNAGNTVQYVFASTNEKTATLLPILNSYLNTLDREKQQQIVYQNSMLTPDYTLQQQLTLHLPQIMLLSLVVVVLLSLVIVLNFRARATMMKKAAQEHERFRELSKLMNECLFEYNYRTDFLRMHNNKFLFDQEHEIPHYSTNRRYRFLNEMIEARQDGSCVFSSDTTPSSWYRVVYKVIRNKNGEPTYGLGRVFNIDAEIASHLALKERAERDSLTKLYNRYTTEEFIAQHLAEPGAQGTMLLFDLDNFKLVNDILGHQTGDMLLQKVAEFVENFFRKEDLKCRLGGDEFLVFLTSTLPQEILVEKLEELIRLAQEAIFLDYPSMNLSLSIGAAYVSENARTFQELYRKADYAMYVAKLNGKNGYYISDSEECAREECVWCKRHCKRREYLRKKKLLEEPPQQ